jgi:hypothetical protein
MATLLACSIPPLYIALFTAQTSYVFTVTDLLAVTPGNADMPKHADDTYLLVPASNVESRAAETDDIEQPTGQVLIQSPAQPGCNY